LTRLFINLTRPAFDTARLLFDLARFFMDLVRPLINETGCAGKGPGASISMAAQPGERPGAPSVSSDAALRVSLPAAWAGGRVGL
jgi:hypothetical protein